MSVWERIFQAVLFEVGAVALTVLALMVFGSDDVLHTGSLAVAISLLAVLWNVVFNHFLIKWPQASGYSVHSACVWCTWRCLKVGCFW